MININLLPPELKFQRLMAKRNATLIGFCVVIILIFATIGLIGKSLESTVEAYLGAAKNDTQKDPSGLEQYQNLQDMALLINDRWQTTQTLEKDRVFWSQVLSDLTNNVPIDVQFENLAINAEKTPNFILSGNTTTEREIIKFKDKLEASVFFKNVTFKSSNLSTGTDPTQKVDKLKFTLDFDLEKKKVE